jgi:N,N'-diacetylchitobiose phosphorylase
LLEMLTPVHHARTRREADVYRVEPYVVAADVYGVEPHVGRGGWTWYTGSAGWLYRVAIESILGLRLEAGRLVLDPRISAGWPGYRLTYRLPDGRTRYEFEVTNPDGRTSGITSGTLDGEPMSVVDGVLAIDPVSDGRLHRVTAVV